MKQSRCRTDRPTALLLLVLSLGLLAGGGAWAAVFRATPNWSSGPSPLQAAVAAGDIDNDGLIDLVCGDFSQPTSVYRNTGSLFTQSPVWNSSRFDPTQSIALGDVDRDGDLDLVCGNRGQRSVLYLNEGGVFGPAPAWTSAEVRTTEEITLVDVGGDGYLDLVLGNRSEPNELYRNEEGLFGARPAWSADFADSTVCLALGDVDGDGRVDLVCGSQARQGRPLLLYHNDGGACGRTPSWISTDSLIAVAVALGDVNGDGRLDLVCGTDRQGIRLYLNNGGGFEARAAWVAPEEVITESVVLGDVDGDGDLDLVAGNFGQKSALYLNDGGVFSATPAWQTGTADRTYTLALADVNADGALDLICGNAQQSTTLYLNEGIVFSANPIWVGRPGGRVTSVALGDIDGDGALDLAAGGLDSGNVVYRNIGRSFPEAPTWRSGRLDRTRNLALADINADGRPDLVCGNTRGASSYLNEGGSFGPSPSWVLENGDSTTAVALGDVDGDGRPDLLCGITGTAEAHSKLYRNEGGRFATNPSWISGPASFTWAAVLGDIDGDRDLDLVLGNQYAGNTLYRNDGGALSSEPSWSSTPPVFTSALALGDLDGDGGPDLVCGNGLTSTTVYPNAGSSFSANPTWSSTDAALTLSLALGDVDGDGDLDLVCGNSGFASPGKTTLYRNEGGRLVTVPVWSSDPPAFTQSVALGDIDDDGDLDLVCGNGEFLVPEGSITVFEGRRAPPFHGDPLAPTNQLPFTSAYVRRVRVESSGTNSRRVSFRAIDLESDPVWILADYQFEGELSWRPVAAKGQTGRVGPLTSSPAGDEHFFDWDITRIPDDPREAILRLRTVSLPQGVGVVREVPAYVRKVGTLAPQRPELALSSELLSFPTVTLGDTVSVQLEISNKGNVELVVDEITLPFAEMQIDPPAPIHCLPGSRVMVGISLAPVARIDLSGEMHLLSNDPLRPDHAVSLVTDIRPLRISSRLLTPGEEIPLGEAVTVIVTPAPQVRIERGYLFHRPAGQGQAFVDSLPLGRSAGDFIGVIPGSAVQETGLEYYIRVENGAARAFDPPGAPGASFRQVVASPAQISSSPTPNSGAGFLEGRPIRVEVRLPQGARMTEGTLYYRRGGERSFQAVGLISTSFPSGTIPDSICSARGVEYWCDVRTMTRELTDPPVAPGEHPRTIMITVPDLVEPRSHRALAYRMFSLPLLFGEESAGTIETLLSDQAEFGPYDRTQWRAFRYDAGLAGYRELVQGTTAPEFRPVPGRSFWLVSREEGRITTAPLRGLSVPTDSAFTVLLKPGWNQVANPFAFPVAWAETELDSLGSVEGLADRIEPPVAWSTDDGYHLGVTRLEPFEGYWLKNLTSSDLRWHIFPLSDTSYATRRGAAVGHPEESGDNAQVDWGIRILARAPGARDLENLAGVSVSASREWDPLDRSEPPPAPGRSISLYFPHGDWPEHPGKYSSDVRDLSEAAKRSGEPGRTGDSPWGYSWEFDVALDDPWRKSEGSSDGPSDAQSDAPPDALPDAPSEALPDAPSDAPLGASDEVRLEFVRVGLPPADLELFLVDRAFQRVIALDGREDPRFLVGQVDDRGAAGAARFLLLAGSRSFVEDRTSALSGAPSRTCLWPAAPNPAEGAVQIRYDLSRSVPVDLSIFDVRGSLVKQLFQGQGPTGRHQVLWRGDDGAGRKVAAGVYYVRLRAPGVQAGRRLVWVR